MNAHTSTTAVRKQATAGDPSLAAIDDLIRRHEEAWKVDNAAWDDIPDPELPLCRIEVARRYLGRDDNGEELYEPVYLFTEDQIRDSYQRNLKAHLSVWGGSPEREASIRAKYEKLLQQRLDELAALKAEVKRVEDESGYTGACKKARATAAIVKAIEAEIIAFVPQSLAAATRKVKWVLSVYEEERCYFADDDFVDILQSIARAAS